MASFNRRDLALIRVGLVYAMDEIHNLIATCPDVTEYAEDLAELRQDKADFEELLARIVSAEAEAPA